MGSSPTSAPSSPSFSSSGSAPSSPGAFFPPLTAAHPLAQQQQPYTNGSGGTSPRIMVEMLHVARECGGSSQEQSSTTSTSSPPSSPTATTPSGVPPGHLTFGEFCLFTTELKRCYEKDTPR